METHELIEQINKLQKENDDLVNRLRTNSENLLDVTKQKIQLQDENVHLKIENIAEIKTSIILFKMVDKAYTHREKNAVSKYVNIILKTDMKDKILEVKNSIQTDLPF